MKSGTRLGSYVILAPIGAGGMGEVYRAQDTKLGRQVAIKILSSELVQSPERLARFKREAQILASLNHPHIAAIYELDEAEDQPFLVLELVEGQDLSERLKHGILPIDEALDVARQVAEALEVAHEKGIIHRDLKPANIKLTADGKVKVLDFGLAKAYAGDSVAEGSDADPSQSPTLTRHTELGVILGTAAYMSPEQAKGRLVDHRADIWAFGCVLYEMLTGRKAFIGDDVTETLASVIKDEVDLSILPKEIHPMGRAVLKGCLEKKVSRRWRDIADVRLQLETVLDVSRDHVPITDLEPPRVRRIRALVISLASVLLASLVAVSVLVYLRPPQERSVSRLSIVLPKEHHFRQSVLEKLDISRDGKKFVYQAKGQLHLKPMVDLTPISLQGTQGAQVGFPTFSPDGEWIAFWADGEIKKVPSTGGTPVTLCKSAYPWGLSWSASDQIFFGQDGRRFLEVSPQGGEAELVLEADRYVANPVLLPDDESLLYTRSQDNTPLNAELYVHQIESGKDVPLGVGGARPYYLSSGHLAYARGGSIFAVPFDLSRLEVAGNPIAVIENVAGGGSGMRGHDFAVSETGWLAYIPVSDDLWIRNKRLVWVDRRGQNELVDAEPAAFESPRLSPGGHAAVFNVAEGPGTGFIWQMDLERGTKSQLTFGANRSWDINPFWSPDGERILFTSNRSRPNAIYWKRADGSGEITKYLEQPEHLVGSSLSRNDILAFYIHDPVNQRDIWTLVPGAEPIPFVATAAQERAPIFSPDGKWIAYISDEYGETEVFVKPFPHEEGAQYRISRNGGVEPVWSRDGKELFFRTNSGDLMAVDIETTPSFRTGIPKRLFEGHSYTMGRQGQPNYDVRPDGKRFLMLQNQPGGELPRINIVVNWFEELKDRVPTN